jgi:The GLUG motif.
MKKTLLFFAAVMALSACDFPDALPPVFDTNTTALYIYDGPTAGSYTLSDGIKLLSSYNWNMENSAPSYITLDSGSYGAGGVHYLKPQITEKLKALLADPDKHFTHVAGQGYLIATLRFSAPSYTGGSHSVTVYYQPDGSFPENPKCIYNRADLEDMANGLNLHYKLMEDIGLEDEEWTPIGPDEDHSFTGSLDGNGKTISSLKISDSFEYVGLFGYIGSGKDMIAVQNLNLKDVDVDVDVDVNVVVDAMKRVRVGAVVGYLDSGIIQGCSVTGTVSAIGGEIELNVGGIVGSSGGHIQNSYAAVAVSVTITGNHLNAAGGIAGTSSGYIQNCYATGAVSVVNGSFLISGGIVGLGSGSIRNCYATGAVSAIGGSEEAYVGGIVGGSYGTMQNCVALNSNVVSNAKTAYTFRIGGNNYNGTFIENYGWENMKKDDASFAWTSALNGADGANCAAIPAESLWTGLGWKSAIWNFVAGNLPTLK